MKSNNHLSFYFSPHSVSSSKKLISIKPSTQSPYLRAVLSGKTRCSSNQKNDDSNMAAALRYISRSR